MTDEEMSLMIIHPQIKNLYPVKQSETLLCITSHGNYFEN